MPTLPFADPKKHVRPTLHPSGKERIKKKISLLQFHCHKRVSLMRNSCNKEMLQINLKIATPTHQHTRKIFYRAQKHSVENKGGISSFPRCLHFFFLHTALIHMFDYENLYAQLNICVLDAPTCEKKYIGNLIY